MSIYEDGSYQCRKGPALIAKVLAGRCQMHYTRAAVGKGTIPEGVSPKDLTEPPEYVMDAMISAVTNPVDGECQVTVQINSKDVETGFYATGIMLYADDPDETEIPYTYLKLEDGVEWIRPKSSAVGKLATFDLIAAVGDVDAVTATIDPDSILTREAVQQLIAEATVIRELTIPKDGWQDRMRDPEDEDEEDPEEDELDGSYGLHLDIPIDGITRRMQPYLTIHPASIDTARACELATFIRSIDGAVRLYAKAAPGSDMTGTLTLLCASTSVIGGGGGSEYVLPPATRTRLGGVKIGSGVDVETDGTISVSGGTIAQEAVRSAAETDENAEAMLEEVFGGAGSGN